MPEDKKFLRKNTKTVAILARSYSAHELGHYFCHMQRQAEFHCGQGDMLDYQGAPSRKMEKEANVFASYLLMPATNFRQQIGDQTITLKLLGQVAGRYLPAHLLEAAQQALERMKAGKAAKPQGWMFGGLKPLILKTKTSGDD